VREQRRPGLLEELELKQGQIDEVYGAVVLEAHVTAFGN